MSDDPAIGLVVGQPTQERPGVIIGVMNDDKNWCAALGNVYGCDCRNVPSLGGTDVRRTRE